MKKRYGILGFVVGGLAAALSHIPLSLANGALSEFGREITAIGTLKSGSIVGDPDLPQIDVTGGLWAALRGKGRLETDQSALKARAAFSPRGLSDIAARIPNDRFMRGIDGLTQLTLSGLPADLKCSGHSGQVQTEFLVYAFAAQGWSGPELTGPIICEGQNWRVDLAGQNESGQFRVQTQISAFEQIDSTIEVTGADGQLENILPSLGFERDGQSWKRREIVPWSAL